MSAFPTCFDDRAQYTSWRRVAILAKEPCAPCSDCTRHYKSQMVEANRCYPTEVTMLFNVNPRIKQPVTKEQS